MTQSSAGTETPSEPQIPPYDLLDVHLHLPPRRPQGSPYASWNLDENGFIEHLDRCGIQRGVLHATLEEGEDKVPGFVSVNRDVLRFRERFRGRFAAACAIELRSIEESLREMEDWKQRFGMVWVAEISFDPKQSASHLEALDRVLQQAARDSMIVSIDTTPEGMTYIAERHPRTIVVFPQLEKGSATQRIDIAGRGENLYLDTSARGYERMGLVELAVEELGAEKLLFGSNFAWNDPAAVIARLENAFLSRDQKQAVFSGSAETLLKRAGWSF